MIYKKAMKKKVAVSESKSKLKEFFRPKIFKLIFTLIFSIIVLFYIYHLIYPNILYAGKCTIGNCPSQGQISLEIILIISIPVIIINYFISYLIILFYNKLKNEK